MMCHLNDLEKTELSRERVQLDGGMFCDLAEYDIRDYGYAAFAENMEVGSGEFRRTRSMMPFRYLNSRARDFDWDIYGEDVSKAKKYARPEKGAVTRGTEEYRGFQVDNVYHSPKNGDIHYHSYFPGSYDGKKKMALYITLPGYQGLYFQGVAENLKTEDFAFEAKKI